MSKQKSKGGVSRDRLADLLNEDLARANIKPSFRTSCTRRC